MTVEEERNILLDLISDRILTPDDWMTFKKKFLLLHPTFFHTIRMKGYFFTCSEERLLALEKLKLTTASISEILGISPRSVHKTRYRLRKKIKAPCTINIIEYIENQSTS